MAIRAALDDDVTILICTPASYWYLQSYLVADMLEMMDYTVFMAYDLRDRRDYGDVYAMSGRVHGNFLRI
jgi:GH18 family chitinase